jgi:hypothetical protein
METGSPWNCGGESSCRTSPKTNVTTKMSTQEVSVIGYNDFFKPFGRASRSRSENQITKATVVQQEGACFVEIKSNEC